MSRDVHALDAHFPALEHLRELARHDHDDCQERELRWTIGIGRGYRWHMHEAAHGDRHARTLLPSPTELDDWHLEVVHTATRRAQVDRG